MRIQRSGLDEELIDIALEKLSPISLDEVVWLHINQCSGDLESPRGAITQRVGLGKILWHGPVLVMRNEDGDLLCASSNRKEADAVRIGKHCDGCEDWLKQCKLHYRICWQDMINKKVCAMTLSRTSSFNYSQYLQRLRDEHLEVFHVVTQIMAEQATRHSAPHLYYRVRFDRLDGRENNCI